MSKSLLAASLVLAMNLFGQFSPLRGSLQVKGEVRHNASASVNELGVELYDRGQHQVIEREHVMNDGSFEFRDVAPGSYEVRLVNRYGDGIRTEYVTVNQGGESVVFQMVESGAKAVSGPVDVSQLKHQVNRKALREFQIAARSIASGNPAASVPHLEKSIQADPDFAGSHHQLGVALMAQREPEKALAEFKKATVLDPALAVGHANLAIVLMTLHRAAEAELAARRAVQLEPSMVKAHFVLALSLLRQQKIDKEALGHLRLAYDDFPQARELGAKLETQLTATKKPLSEP